MGVVLQGPGGGHSGVGHVGAVGAGAHGPAKVLTEAGVVLADARHRLPHGARHPGPGALGRRRGTSVAATQADRARQLPQQEVALDGRLRRPRGGPLGVSFVEVLVDLGASRRR